MGVPLTKTCVAAFEPGTTIEQKYGVQGEICIKTPTMMLGYYKNPDATKDIIWNHSDGEWVHTGDVGYVDENGFVYIVDRIKRIIPRSGFKVFPSQIENLFMKHSKIFPYVIETEIAKHEAVVEACAVGRLKENSTYYEMYVYVVINDKEHESIIKEELFELVHANVSSKMQP